MDYRFIIVYDYASSYFGSTELDSDYVDAKSVYDAMQLFHQENPDARILSVNILPYNYSYDEANEFVEELKEKAKNCR